LVSGGWCFVWLASLHWICDVRRRQTWAFPFLVIGANSILIYVLSWTVADPLREMRYRHFGREPFQMLGTEFTTTLSGAAVMLILFYGLLWLYRRKVFIKI